MRHDQTYVTFTLVVTSPLHKSHNQEMVEVVVSRKSQRSLLRGKRSRMTILRSSLKHSKYSNPAQLWLLLSCHFILKEGCCLDNMGTRGLQAYEETLVWHYMYTYLLELSQKCLFIIIVFCLKARGVCFSQNRPVDTGDVFCTFVKCFFSCDNKAFQTFILQKHRKCVSIFHCACLCTKAKLT